MLRYIAFALGLIPILVGAVTLAGWQLDHYLLKRIVNSPIPVNPLTSVLFILLGLVMFFGRLRLLCALVIAAAALLKCADLFLGTAFNVDGYLYSGELLFEPAFPNRMAPTTTLCFLCMALALGFDGKIRVASLSPVAAISLYTLAAYAFSDGSFRSIPFFTPMALITAITFLAGTWGVGMKTR